MNDSESVDRKSLSQVPSWIMLGFVVGVITMWLFRSSPEPQTEPAAAVITESAADVEAEEEPQRSRARRWRAEHDDRCRFVGGVSGLRVLE